MGQARSAVADRGRAAFEAFAEKPVRNSVKALGIGVLGATGGVPAVLGGAAVLALRARQQRRENPVNFPSSREQTKSRILDQYQNHLAAVSDEPGVQESAPVDMRKKEGYQELQGNGVAEQSMGTGAPPQDPTLLDGSAPAQDPTHSTVPTTAGRSSAPPTFGPGPGASPSVGRPVNTPANLQPTGAAEQSMGNGSPPQDPARSTVSATAGRSSDPTSFGAGPGTSSSVGRPANTPVNSQVWAPRDRDSLPTAAEPVPAVPSITATYDRPADPEASAGQSRGSVSAQPRRRQKKRR